MFPSIHLLLLSGLALVSAKTTKSSSGYDFYSTSFSTLASYTPSASTGTRYNYFSSNGQITLSGSGAASSSSSSSRSSNGTQSTRTTHKVHLTTLGGGGGGRATSQTASSTSSAPTAKNTIPCNGWPEFCERSYSNITNVCAHNAAFAIKNNAGSNQIYGIRQQLDDGIRALEGETHYVNGSILNCHTTCQLLDAGPFSSSLEILVDWLKDNPYNVVTWFISNSDFVNVEKYVPAIQQSGIREYLYEPDYVPQYLHQWPTLGEMILRNKRVVLFMDYNANQSSVPYILPQYDHAWQTPFSPTNRNFPCVQGSPTTYPMEDARDKYMYVANHNLNTAVDLSALIGSSGPEGQEVILIPNTAEINNTNGAFNQIGQAEATRLNCTKMWNRPPNFIVVDYYNFGMPHQGSVFEVAARANGVKYNYDRCCKLNEKSAASSLRLAGVSGWGMTLALAVGTVGIVLLIW